MSEQRNCRERAVSEVGQDIALESQLRRGGNCGWDHGSRVPGEGVHGRLWEKEVMHGAEVLV